MKPSQLEKVLAFCIPQKYPCLIKGAPGVGKSDMVSQATKDVGADLIISHPVVSDPTDYKGLPYASGGEAHFLPFGELKKILEANKPTVFFLDDLGQSPPAVQASCMQLILAREINGHKVSDEVTFIAATNRKEDKAAVTGLLEPVKSRFATIVELEVNTDDWVRWALTKGNMPVELISFVRFRPELLNDFKPTKDIINSPCPRTVANVGRMQTSGLPEELQFDVFAGAAGEAFSAEYTAFLKIFKNLPNIDKILMAPDSVEVPTEPGVLYALSAALAARINDANSNNAFSFIKRLPVEVSYACVKDTVIRKPDVLSTRAFIKWASDNGNFVLGD